MKNIPDNAILVTADVVELYPSMPHEAELRAFKEVLDRREEKKISTEDLVKMAEFVLKNKYFEFNGQVKHQISGTATIKYRVLTFILSLQININICIIHRHT